MRWELKRAARAAAWALGCVLLAAALVGFALRSACLRANAETLEAALAQSGYAEYWAGRCQSGLEELGRAAGLDDRQLGRVAALLPDAAESARRQLALEQPEPEQWAGARMREQLEARLAEWGLEEDDSMAQKLTALQAEGDRLHRQALETPGLEELGMYLAWHRQRTAALHPLWLGLTGALGCTLLALAGRRHSRLLPAGGMGGALGAAGLLLALQSRLAAPTLAGECAVWLQPVLEVWYLPVTDAVHGWILALEVLGVALCAALLLPAPGGKKPS